MKIISRSAEETKKIASDLAKMVRQAHHKTNVIALTGDLGSGKTTFVQGFAKGLGIKEKIISPTFVLIRQHKIPGTKKTLFHVDLYRLETDTLNNVGIKEILADPQNIVLIEWAEKAKKLLPENTKWVMFKTIDDNTREITTPQVHF